jgi:hypothetical protein
MDDIPESVTAQATGERRAVPVHRGWGPGAGLGLGTGLRPDAFADGDQDTWWSGQQHPLPVVPEHPGRQSVTAVSQPAWDFPGSIASPGGAMDARAPGASTAAAGGTTAPGASTAGGSSGGVEPGTGAAVGAPYRAVVDDSVGEGVPVPAPPSRRPKLARILAHAAQLVAGTRGKDRGLGRRDPTLAGMPGVGASPVGADHHGPPRGWHTGPDGVVPEGSVTLDSGSMGGYSGTSSEGSTSGSRGGFSGGPSTGTGTMSTGSGSGTYSEASTLSSAGSGTTSSRGSGSTSSGSALTSTGSTHAAHYDDAAQHDFDF